jgi:hypothetical protein
VKDRRREKAMNLSDVLDEVGESARNDPTPESFTLSELIDAAGRRTYGPMLLVIGLFAISPVTIVPGLTWLAAVLTLVVAGQMALGLRRIWLPRRALETKLPRNAVISGLEKARPWARRIDAVLKPRLTFLTHPPFVNLIALLVIVAALVTFPLGLIPLAPLLPGIAVVFFGLGMAARDGLWLLLGILAVGGACWLARPFFS